MSDDNIQKPSSKITTENKLGFRITSGVTLTDGELKNEVTDYTMFTDEGQGIAWYKNGLHRLVTNGCSYETVGVGKRGEQKENQPAKLICASTGNICLECQDGDVLVKGRNIRFEAENELTLVSSKHISLDCSILNLKGTNTNVLATQRLSQGANFLEAEGGAGNESGTSTDAIKGGFLGKIIKAFGRFKDFL
tara:strand:+ start:4975 stop:5553 length:579 start_codon:yes stop_codon:yes gene_type:complete